MIAVRGVGEAVSSSESGNWPSGIPIVDLEVIQSFWMDFFVAF